MPLETNTFRLSCRQLCPKLSHDCLPLLPNSFYSLLNRIVSPPGLRAIDLPANWRHPDPLGAERDDSALHFILEERVAMRNTNILMSSPAQPNYSGMKSFLVVTMGTDRRSKWGPDAHPIAHGDPKPL